jgi:hypothetical protein
MLEMHDGIDRLVEQVAVMADEKDRIGIGGEILFQPQRAFEVEIVGRLVQQQQVRLAEQNRRQRHAHAPAARKLPRRPILPFILEPQALEDRGGARLRGMRIDIGQPRINLADPVRVGRGLGLFHQRRALFVGGQHHVQHGFLACRRFLRHRADPRLLVDVDGARIRGDMLLDQVKQRGLAGAVLADETGFHPIGQHQGGVFQQHAALDTIGQVIDTQHGNSSIRCASTPRAPRGRGRKKFLAAELGTLHR